MAKSQIADTERIFKFGIGAVRTVLVHSPHAIAYRLERLNEAGNWITVLERYFTPQQFIEFCGNLERQIPRIETSIDRIRDSLNVSIYLASDDLSQDQETSTPRDSE